VNVWQQVTHVPEEGHDVCVLRIVWGANWSLGERLCVRECECLGSEQSVIGIGYTILRLWRGGGGDNYGWYPLCLRKHKSYKLFFRYCCYRIVDIHSDCWLHWKCAWRSWKLGRILHCRIFIRFLGAFAKFCKATISIVMSVRPSVRLSCMEQLGSQWTDFDEVWY
jgi:hypothetical protein